MSAAPLDCDVVVIGAGVAGLNACRELTKAGVFTICLEARNRIGGRVHTIVDRFSPVPIELGAEFIHGRPPESWGLIRTGALLAFDCEENSVHLVDGEVQRASDAWEQIDAITEEMKKQAATGHDISFAEFIETLDYSDEAKAGATSFVEGFNAAHKEKISVASLVRDSAAAEAISGDMNFRLGGGGYRDLLQTLWAGIDHGRAEFQFNRVVEQVRWQPGRVEVQARSGFGGAAVIVRARAAVVTLPLGVLQAKPTETGFVEFIPRPEEVLQAAQALCFGQVMRLVLRFSRPWWEDNPELADAGFWLSQEQAFPTWWTTLPVRSSVLVGWSAGPHADGLLGRTQDEIVEVALRDLSRITRVPVEELGAALEAAHFHDWSADPFARGAYSYVPAGVLPMVAVLSRPVDDTLYFAGEATEMTGHGATVHGALATGQRAAAQILSSGAWRSVGETP